MVRFDTNVTGLISFSSEYQAIIEFNLLPMLATDFPRGGRRAQHNKPVGLTLGWAADLAHGLSGASLGRLVRETRDGAPEQCLRAANLIIP